MFRVKLSFEAPGDETIELDDHQQALYATFQSANEQSKYVEADAAWSLILDSLYGHPFYEYIDDIYRPTWLQRADEEESN